MVVVLYTKTDTTITVVTVKLLEMDCLTVGTPKEQ
jgi:hypothetical protein